MPEGKATDNSRRRNQETAPEDWNGLLQEFSRLATSLEHVSENLEHCWKEIKSEREQRAAEFEELRQKLISQNRNEPGVFMRLSRIESFVDEWEPGLRTRISDHESRIAANEHAKRTGRRIVGALGTILTGLVVWLIQIAFSQG